jgi:hypothetical protein
MKKRKGVVIVAFGASCAWAAACSLSADFDGLVGGDASSAEGAAGPDSAPSLGDGQTSPPDGAPGGDGSSSSGSDASTAPDGDAGASAIDGGGDAGFCTIHPGHTLCEDFDEADAIAPSWVPNLQSGTVALDTVSSTSAPRSLVAKVVSLPSKATIQHAMPAGNTQVTFEAFVKVSGATSDVEVHSVYFLTKNDPNVSDCYIDVGVISGTSKIQASCNLQDGGVTQDEAVIPTAGSLSTYTRLHVVVDTSAMTATATVISNGVSATPGTAKLPATIPDAFIVGVGISYCNNGSPTVHEDNVLVDVK